MKRFNKSLLFDRTIYGSTTRQIMVFLGITLFIFFGMGSLFILLWGDSIGHVSQVRGEHLWQLYYYFADPGNQMSMEEKATGARAIGLIMSTLGSIFLGGLLISTITNVIERRVELSRAGKNYYKLRDHAVIIGSDQMVQGIVPQLAKTDVEHIVVLATDGVEMLRDHLLATLPDKKSRKKLLVNYGPRDAKSYLSAINITEAREVYILGDESEFDDIESYHDSLNVECLRLIAELCKEKGRKGLPCRVSFNYKTTYHVFQFADLSEEVRKYIDFNPFNFCEFWTQKVLVANSNSHDSIVYSPLDYRPILSQESDEYVHLIVIGLSHMGQAMALQAAHIAHYPNYRKKKTRITIIDRNMRQEMHEFKQKCGELFELCQSEFIDADIWANTGEKVVEEYGLNEKEYGHLVTEESDKDFIDLRWTFIQGDDCNPRVRQLLDEYVRDKEAIVTVAVCLNITHRSLRSAMYLPKAYYEKEIPILVQQRKTETIVDTINGKGLSEEDRKKLIYKNVKPFGMIYDCYDLDLALSVRYCKRINAAYNYFSIHHHSPAHLDDEAVDADWEKLPTSKRWSNIFAAASIPTKLRSIGYPIHNLSSSSVRIENLTDEQIQILSEVEHNRWNVEELLLGYRPVTAAEDSEIDENKDLKASYRKRYIHYDIRPYDGLKTDQNGVKASLYDEMIIRSLPVIVNH